MISSNELRQKFLDFFSAKGGSASGGRGHIIVPSSSLIPEGDASVLFTTAGMQPLIPYLLGEKHPGGKRLASVQKCIRTGDIDEVGDNVHLTFFEMLGNWSLGDYWKDKSIAWSLEFLTQQLHLSLDKLAVSCFIGDGNSIVQDDDSARIWQALGIPKERIMFLGKEDNWWGPPGATGPCGPDTEVFYWTGEEAAPKFFDPGNKLWVEIWNNVFMEYQRLLTKKGEVKFMKGEELSPADYYYEPLKQRNVDTGMGLERTLAVINGYNNVFAIEEFQKIISKIKELATRPDDKAVRVIADHIKAATFIMADPSGVKPSNIGRGYVVRRLIREAIEAGKSIGIKSNFVTAVARVTISLFENVYPELKQNSDFIIDELMVEEGKYSKSISQGLKEIRRLYDYHRTLGAIRGVTGKEFFDLYQSFAMRFQTSFEEWNRLCDTFKTPGLSLVGRKNELALEYADQLKKHQDLSKTSSAGMFKGGLVDHEPQTIKHHTAHHLLLAALRQILGNHVLQRGSNVSSERLRIDFSHPEKVTAEQLKQIEEIVNKAIQDDLEVKREEMPKAEAEKLGALAEFGAKYSDTVTVYTILNKDGSVFSREFCGGPHVTHTGELGIFKITKEEAVAAGIRRIKASVK